MKRPQVDVTVVVMFVVAATLFGGCATPIIEVTAPQVDDRVIQDSPLLFRVVDGRSKYRALAGPLDEGSEVKTYLHQSTVTLGVTAGWAYLVGEYPVSETTLVHAGAIGTTMIVASYPTFSRVVFLCTDDGKGVLVTSKLPVLSGSNTRTLSDRWSYVDGTQLRDKLEFSAIKHVPHPGDPDPDGARDLVERVKRAVDAAGVGGWCNQP